jgi:succinate dehydrogenase hydrophobic anchor subunit
MSAIILILQMIGLLLFVLAQVCAFVDGVEDNQPAWALLCTSIMMLLTAFIIEVHRFSGVS